MKRGLAQGPCSVIHPPTIDTLRLVENKGGLCDLLLACRLGFNATYHLTDVPSFVSGEHLVQFDPSAKYLPGVNLAQPGAAVLTD